MNNTVLSTEKGKSKIKYITLFALCFLLVGFFSALLTGDSSVYSELNKPPLSPPPEVFAIVWSVLYVVIGGVFGAVYCYEDTKELSARNEGLLFSLLGFVFNLLWYPLFFGKGQFLAALIDIVVILLLNIIAAKKFYKIKPVYAYLTVVYIAWLLFAFYLNLGFIILN